MSDICPFCEIAVSDSNNRIVLKKELGFAIRDGYPISEGHTLIIPKRHVASFFELADAEKAALFNLLNEAKEALDQKYRPAAYNIGKVIDGRRRAPRKRNR